MGFERRTPAVKHLLTIAAYQQTQNFKMTMWADNVKFVKDILDSKYQKIDSAVHEFTEIEMLLETIISEMSGKEKDMLEKEAKEKVAKRSTCSEKAKELRTQLKL